MIKFIFLIIICCSSLCISLCGCDNNQTEINVDIDKAVQDFEKNVKEAEKNIADESK